MTRSYYRVFVGPQWLSYTDASHYAWTALNRGTALPNSGMVTNDEIITAAFSGDLYLSGNISSIASKGGLWFQRPDGSMAHITYTSKNVTDSRLWGVTMRSGHSETNDNVPIGSTGYQWWPVPYDNGSLDISEAIDSEYVHSAVRFTLAGIVGNKQLLSPGHFVAVEEHNGDGVWKLLLLGTIKRARLSDDFAHIGNWTVEVVSPIDNTRFDKLPGIRYGEWNIATEINIQASSTLSHRFLEYQSGDIDNGYQEFTPDNVTDEDIDTLWISNYHVNGPAIGGKDGLTIVYFQPPSGLYEGASFLQVQNKNNNYHTERSQRSGAWVYDINDSTWHEIESDGPSTTNPGYLENDLSDGGIGLVVEREDEFEQVYGGAEYEELRDLQSRTQAGSINFFDHFRPGGGALFIQSNYGAWKEGVHWGSVGSWPGNPPPIGGATPSGGSQYVGTNPGPGYAIVAIGGTFSWQKYIVPGHMPNVGANLYEWLYATLPPLDRRSDAERSIGNGYITVRNKAGDLDSSGLPNVNGQVTIGAYNYTVTNKDSISISISPGLQEKILEGAPIYTYHHGQTTEGYPLKKTRWERDGLFVPYAYELGWANVNGRLPNRSEYINDYMARLILTNTGYLQSGEVSHLDSEPNNGFRTTSLYMLFTRMGNSVSKTLVTERARLNQLELLVDRAFFPDSEEFVWHTTDSSAQQVIKAMLDRTRLGPAATILNYNGPTFKDYITEPGYAYPIVMDTAKVGGVLVRSRWDGKISLAQGNLIARNFSSVALAGVWDEADIKTVDIEQSADVLLRMLTLEYILPDGSTGTYIYPAGEVYPNYGQDVGAGPFLVLNEAQAAVIALNLWNIMQLNYTVNIELADGAWGSGIIEPGTFHSVTWPWSEEGTLARKFLVTQVNQNINNTTLVTAFSGVEVGRSTI